MALVSWDWDETRVLREKKHCRVEGVGIDEEDAEKFLDTSDFFCGEGVREVFRESELDGGSIFGLGLDRRGVLGIG